MEHIIFNVDKETHIATITLNNQPLNICDRFFYKEITEAFKQVNEIDGISVVIVNSACKHFCAGGKLEEIQECNSRENVDIIAGAAAGCMEAIYTCKYPVIAAVNGKAIGAGSAIAACCDITIATEKTVFAVPEITAGYIGASEFLQMVIPHRLARYYVYTGEFLTAQEMYRLGAVLEVVKEEDLMECALKVAKKIATQSPLALMYFKESMNHNDDERLVEKYMYEADYTLKYNASEDCKETYIAFKERRKPVFKGR